MNWRVFTRVLVSLFLILSITSKAVAATRGGINIGPYYEEFSQAANAIGTGGWVYVLGCPGNIPAIQASYKANPQVKLMIRAYFKYPEINSPAKAQKLATEWANVLKAMDTPNMVYFMPANEINNPTEQFIPSGSKEFTADSLSNLKIYLDTLQSSLQSIRGSKVKLLSPSIDPFQLTDAGVGSTQAKQLGTINWGAFDGISVSLYGQYTASGSLDTSAGPLKRGEYSALSNYGIPSGGNIYVVETGVIKVGEGVAYQKNSSLITNYLKLMQAGPWASQQVKAATIFSYNPDKNIEFGWIYSSPVVAALRGLSGGDNIQATSIPPTQFDWNSLTACNLKNKSNLEPIRRQCSQKDQNTVGSIPPAKALQKHLLGDNTAQVVPATTEQNFPKMDHPALTEVAKKMTPNHQKYIPAEEIEGAFIPEGKQAIIGNKEPMPKTTRFTLEESVNKLENGQLSTTKTTQVAGSVGDLYNTKDDPYLRKLADDTAILGKYTSTTRLPSYDLTVAPEIVEEQLVPCLGNNNTKDLPIINTSPEGFNLFTTSGNLGDQIRSIAAGLASQTIIEAIKIIGGLVRPGQSAEQTIADALRDLGVETKLCSCTVISHGEVTVNRANKFINSMIPNDSIKKIKNDKESAKTTNQYKMDDIDITIDNTSAGLNQVDKGMTALYCSSIPNGTQKYLQYCKGINPPNTSNWAVAGAQTPYNVENKAIDTIINEEAASVGIPACVLRGVGIIEGAYGWDPNNAQQIQSCSVNVCSAMGPFQFTTGNNGRGDSCASCGGLSYCPNAWAVYGNGKNPCEPRAAANAAARKLQADGDLTTADPQSQFTGILNAGYHYYGSRQPVGRLKDSFGNACSYGEYVFLQCNPSYKCGTQR